MALFSQRYQETVRARRVALIWLIALVMAALAMMGCASAAAPATTTSEPTAAAGSSPEGVSGIFEELIGLVPDAPGNRGYVRIVDHAQLEKALDLPMQPDDSAIGAAEILRMGRTFLSFYDVAVVTQPNLREYLALTPEIVDQSLLTGVAPQQAEVLRGRFDPDATEQALAACSGECLPPDVREEYQGVTFYSWGEDFQGNLRVRHKPPAFDRLGRGGRIAVQNQYVFRTLGTDDMKGLIDAGLGRRPSLADAEEFRLPARVLSELNCHDIYLSDTTQSLSELDSYRVMLSGEAGTYDWLISDEENRRTYKVLFWGGDGSSVGVQMDSPLEEVQHIREELQQSLLRPYLAYGTGRGLDSDGRHIGIVLVHADEESATENVALLQQRIEGTLNLAHSKPWRETVDIEKMEIRIEGRLLVARLPLPEKEFAEGIPTFDSAYTLDALLLHQ